MKELGRILHILLITAAFILVGLIAAFLLQEVWWLVIVAIVWALIGLNADKKVNTEYKNGKRISKDVDTYFRKLYTEDLSSLIESQRASDREAFYKTDMTSVPEAMYDEYNEYLHSDEWIELSFEIRWRDNNTCQHCGTTRSLEVHHTSYKGIFELDFTEDQLTTLCTSCHTTQHLKLKEN